MPGGAGWQRLTPGTERGAHNPLLAALAAATAASLRAPRPQRQRAATALPLALLYRFRVKRREEFQDNSGIAPMRLAPGHGGFLQLQLNLKLGEVPRPRFDPVRPKCKHLAEDVRTLGAGARRKKGRAVLSHSLC